MVSNRRGRISIPFIIIFFWGTKPNESRISKRVPRYKKTTPKTIVSQAPSRVLDHKRRDNKAEINPITSLIAMVITI